MEILAHLPFTDVRPFLDHSQTQLLARPDWRSSTTWSAPRPPAREAFVRWLGPANRADGDDFGWCSAARLLRLPPPGVFAGALRGFTIGDRTLGVNGSGALRLELAVTSRLLPSPASRAPVALEPIARQLLATEFCVGVKAGGATTGVRLADIGSAAAHAMLAATTPMRPPVGYKSSVSWLTAGRPMLLGYYEPAQRAQLPPGAVEVPILSRVPCHYSALTFNDVRVGIWYVGVDGGNLDDVRRLDQCLRRRHALRETLVGLCRSLQELAGQIDEKALLRSMDVAFGTLYDKKALYGIRRPDLEEIDHVESRNVSTIGDGTLVAITTTITGHSNRLWRNVQHLRRSPQEALERGTPVDQLRWCLTGAGTAALSGAAVFCEIVLASIAGKHGPPVSVPLRVVGAILGAVALATVYAAGWFIWYGTFKRAKRVVPMVRRRLGQLGWFNSLFLIPALLTAFLIS